MENKNLIIQINHLKKIYGKQGNAVSALKDISFDVQKGEFVAIMGASGSGKTTLLNILATIDQKTSGSIFMNGIDLDTLKNRDLTDFRKTHIGFIFQDYTLLNSLNAYENIALSLLIKENKHQDIEKKVLDIAESFHIKELLKQYPYQLSGGQKQRVAACRALVPNPDLILADEPTGALDSKSSMELLEILSQVNQERKDTILMVTHDPLAASYAKRIIFIKDGCIQDEIVNKQKDRKEFYNQVMECMMTLGA